MEPYDFRCLPLIEVASHGIANLTRKIVESIRFREDWRAERAGCISALGRFLDHKDQLAHRSPRMFSATAPFWPNFSDLASDYRVARDALSPLRG